MDSGLKEWSNGQGEWLHRCYLYYLLGEVECSWSWTVGCIAGLGPGWLKLPVADIEVSGQRMFVTGSPARTMELVSKSG